MPFRAIDRNQSTVTRIATANLAFAQKFLVHEQ